MCEIQETLGRNGRKYDLFAECISSQLLLYQLVIMFGMPPSNIFVDDEFRWGVRLYHVSGKCNLIFGDYKGKSFAHFGGPLVANADALELLDLLCAKNFPHGHKGIVAGPKA